MSQYTPGPWEWDVRRGRNAGRTAMLTTARRGKVFVMGFTRSGMQGAQPVFQVHREGCDQTCTGCGRMEPLTKISGEPDHNGQLFVEHPDAVLIAAAPELAEMLARIVDEGRYHWPITEATDKEARALLERVGVREKGGGKG